MQHAVAQNRFWDAVVARDPGAPFVYGVRTTGIYCRPGCPSRRPKRESVAFFATPDAAELAGFRACRRCHPRQGVPVPPGIGPVRRACAFIAAHVDETIRLARLAGVARTSPFHLQRSFTRLVGLSPRAYQDALRAARFRAGLRRGTPLSAAIYEAGYGSISRVYERRPTGAGMTPAEYRARGAGASIAYTVVPAPLGRLLVAGTEKGVCAVMLGDGETALEGSLRGEYPRATLTRDDAGLARRANAIVAHLDGRRPHLDLPLDVQATAFQWMVWRQLQTIPYGETRTYSEVARAIGKPAAVRAVARACATNPACVVVPCHRVVRKDGGLGGYRWGLERKRQMLARESRTRAGRGRT
jgi:AraC family transcriptional regulator of adaptative response/methylated-DNA-[protein]-cysteine methyltransferase